MTIRQLTPRTGPVAESNRDWMFGYGMSNILTGQDAIAEAIEMALQIFRGEVWWFTNYGIDWWNILASKGAQNSLNTLVVQAREVILGVSGVISATNVSATIQGREAVLQYSVNTIYGTVCNFSTINLQPPAVVPLPGAPTSTLPPAELQTEPNSGIRYGIPVPLP